MVVVVANPRLVASDGTGRLDPPNKTRGGQGSEHVIHRLPRHFGQVGAHRAENRLGVSVRVGVYRLQHRQPRARHAKVSCTELIRVIRRGCHGNNIAPFLESVKSFGRSISALVASALRSAAAGERIARI